MAGPKKKLIPKPKRSKDVPATAGMLEKFEARISSKFTSFKLEVKSDLHDMKSEIHGMKSEIQGIKAEIHGLKSRFDSFEGQLHGVKSEVHRIAVLVEEQNARNRYVMDGYAQMYEIIRKEFGVGEPFSGT